MRPNLTPKRGGLKTDLTFSDIRNPLWERQTCNQFDFKAALLLLWLLIFLPYISGWLADHFGSRLVFSSAIVLFILFVLQRAPAKD